MVIKEKIVEYIATDDSFINELRQGYPLESNEAYQVLRFLVVFALGCRQLGVQAELFNRRLELYVTDLYKMGYRTEKVLTLVEWACDSIRIEGLPRLGKY